MTILLNTHTLLWWLNDDVRLSLAARHAISDTRNMVLVSAASAWEICTKYRIGKLPGVDELANNFDACIRREGFLPLDISVAHAQRAGLLSGEHRDPFDRMLMAQALALDVPIVSNELLFESFGVRRIW